MKKHLSFSRLLHKEKLMMIVSLILAIVIWALVDESRGFVYRDTFEGVPVQVKLTSYAMDRGLRIVEGADITATVEVSGTRAELRGLKASDISVVADAQAYLNEGDYEVSLVATSTKGTVVDITGTRIHGDSLQGKTIWISCKRYVDDDYVLTTAERGFTLNEEQIALSGVKQAENVRIASVILESETIKDGMVKVYGLNQSLEKINTISVDLSDVTVSRSERLVAPLRAYDSDGKPIEGLTFMSPKSAEVGVIISAVTYREEPLSVEVINAPEGFDTSKLVVSPNTLVLGEVSGEKSVLDSYIKDIKKSLVVDFNTWQAEKLTIPLVEKEGVYLDRMDSDHLTIYLDAEGYNHVIKTMQLTPGENVRIQCDEGLEAKLLQDKLPDVVFCGPKALLKDLDSEDILIEIDATGQAEGQDIKSKNVKIQITMVPENGEDILWVYYGAEGYEIEYSVQPIASLAEVDE